MWRPRGCASPGGQAWEQGDTQCPALPRYRDKDQPVLRCQRAMPCWKDRGQGSHQRPPQHLGAREVSPGDSEEKFRLLRSPTGFLAPLNLHNSPSAVPRGQWDPCSSRAPCGSRRFLRSAPALALAHTNKFTNGSLPARGAGECPPLVSSQGSSPSQVPREDCKPSRSACLCCVAAGSRSRQRSGQ